jgi:protein transport protein SEC24
MLAVHDLAADVGFLGAHGRLRLPAFMRASYAYMVAEGAYILCESSKPIYVVV